MTEYYKSLINKYGKIKIGYPIGNLCDALLLTPIFKYIKDVDLYMHTDDVSSKKSCIFDGMANIILNDDMPPPCNRTNDKDHISSQYLKSLLGEGIYDILPWIILKDEEIQWAKDFLKKYDNPIVFIPTNGCSHDKSNFFSQARTFTPEMIEYFINILKSKYTILQFGIDNFYVKSSRFETPKINGVINIMNLSIRQMAACYKVIGKMVSCDTGHPYLMVAVGGKVIEMVPKYLGDNVYPFYQYTYVYEYIWKNKEISAYYFDMSDYKNSKYIFDLWNW